MLRDVDHVFADCNIVEPSTALSSSPMAGTAKSSRTSSFSVCPVFKKFKVSHLTTLSDWLDGMPITVAMLTFNILHPGRLVWNKERIEPENLSKHNSSNFSSKESLVANSKV
jgi:hypothetical protein